MRASSMISSRGFLSRVRANVRQLALTAGKRHPEVTDAGLEPPGELGYEVGPAIKKGPADRPVVGLGPGPEQVLANAGIEAHRVLSDAPDPRAQRGAELGRQALAVDTDRPRARSEQTHHEAQWSRQG